MPDYTSYAIQLPISPQQAERFDALSLVLSNAVLLMVAANGLAITPQVGDGLTWGGQDYTIQYVSALAPDGTALAYDVLAGQ